MTVLWGMHDAGVAAFAQLLRASVDGGLFVLTVLLLVRVVPSLPARAVTIAWWLARAWSLESRAVRRAEAMRPPS